MNALELIRLYRKEHEIAEIVSDPVVIARGFVFLVELRDKHYILVNSRDLDIAIVQVFEDEFDNIQNYLDNMEVRESMWRAMEILQGVVVCASRVK